MMKQLTGTVDVSQFDDYDQAMLLATAHQVVREWPNSSSDEQDSDAESEGGVAAGNEAANQGSASMSAGAVQGYRTRSANHSSIFSPAKHFEAMSAQQLNYYKRSMDEGTIWENNGGVSDVINFGHGQEIVSVSRTNQRDQRMFDVYVSLKTMPQDRFHIQVTQKQDFNALFDRIRESLELKYEQLKGLKGLRVKEIAKIQPMLQNNRKEVLIYN